MVKCRKISREVLSLFYLFMILWIITSLSFIVGLVYWLIKKKNGKLVFISLISSILFLLLGIVSNSTVDFNNKNEIIIDASQFNNINPNQLVELMGQPELIEEWEFKLSENRSYDVKTYLYNDDAYEFMIIDNKVVRFTYNGQRIDYQNSIKLIRLFNLEIDDGIKLVREDSSIIRYQNVNNYVDDFWVTIFDDNITLKITYDMKYFS